VLTDLYVQKQSHTREEEHRYTELVLWLIASVDVPTRAAVSRKLASYAHAPRLVARRLARDVFEVAEPMLKWSPCLTAEDLLAIIRDFGPRYAQAIGHRENAQAADATMPTAGELERTEWEVAPVETRTAAAPGTAPAPDIAPAPEPAAREPLPAGRGLAPLAGKSPRVSIGAYFLAAGATERRLLLANLQDGALSPSKQVFAAATEVATEEFEAAALARRPDDFVRGLERSLCVSNAVAEAIIADDAGEPLVVAAKALGMRSDTFLRVLLFLNPVIGHSVERVFDLVNLYDQLSAEAALHIVSSWQNAVAADQRSPRHQPLHWDDEARGARQTFAAHARRPSPQVPEDRRPAAASDERLRAQRTT
jgi:hypothetical protein